MAVNLVCDDSKSYICEYERCHGSINDYYIPDTWLNYSSAEYYCQNYLNQGHLAVIECKEEENFLCKFAIYFS